MRAGDIEKLYSLSRPSLAPDGSCAVVSASHPDLASDRAVGQLWRIPLDGSKPVRMTRGIADGDPQFSPDGAAIAFLRSTGDATQLFVIPAAGGEPQALTATALGVSSFSWSPDSRRIVYVSRVPEQGRYGTVKEISASAEPARRIDRLNYKYNGTGYTIDRPSHLFLVTIQALDAEPVYTRVPQPDGVTPEISLVPVSVQLTHGDFNDYAPRFVGDRVAFVSTRHAERDTDLLDQLWIVSEGAEPEPLTPVPGTLSIEVLEPADDGSIYLLAQEMGETGLDFVGRNSALYRLHDGALTRLTDPETIDLTGASITLLPASVLVENRARGRRQLVEVLGVDDVRQLTTGDIQVEGVAASATATIFSYASPDTFGDVAKLENGDLVRLTDFSSALRESGVVSPIELEITSRDGYPVHGWVARPTGEGRHPTLLMIHGGPFADYGVHVFDETQVYVDAGYAVVYCNPRGSAGYGQAHSRSIQRAMGTVDYTDVLDFLEGALDAWPDLDRDRLGILGGSYGGYLTAWTIGNDHRFRAAVVERGYLDPAAFVGSSDIGMSFPQQYNGTDPDLIAAQSPQAVARNVTTPTLVIHSEQDLRCPIGQAETYYATLRLNGIDAEMLVFPGENHELSRSGRPRHRVQRFEAILEWFGRHL